MNTQLNTGQWREILSRPDLTNDTDISLFRALYSFEGHKAAASQIGILLGYKGKSPHAPLNSEIGRYAKRIARHYEIGFTERSAKKYKYWDLFFSGWNSAGRFIWQLRPELAQALEVLDLTGIETLPEELPGVYGAVFLEGSRKTITVNSYERNPQARNLCVKHWGCECVICGFNFEKIYGHIGNGYTHVHHLTPVSEIGKSYQINPEEDLRPVCPNCHAMLHKRTPPFTIEELKQQMQNKRMQEIDHGHGA